MPNLNFGSRGAARAHQDMEKLIDLAREQGQAIERTQTKWSQMDRTAQQIARRQETSQNRFNRLLGETQQAFDAGRISAEDYEGEIAAIGKEYENSEGRFKKFAETQKRGFSESTNLITKYADGARLIESGWRLALKALEEYNQEQERGQELSKSAQLGIGLLKTLADTQQEFEQFTGQARSFFGAGATGADFNAAANAIFTLQSAELGAAIPLFQQLAATGVVPQVDVLAESVRKQLGIFGAEEVGTVEQQVAKAFAIGKRGIGTPPELLRATLGPSTPAKALGLSDEEVGGAIASLSTAFRSPEVASTRLRAFLQSIATFEGAEVQTAAGRQVLGPETFRGLNLEEITNTLQDLSLDAAQLKDVLKNDEAVAGFDALATGIEGLVENIGLVDTANERAGTIIQTKLGFRDPATAAQRRKQRSENLLGLIAENQGTIEAEVDAAQNLELARAGGRGGGVDALARTGLRVARFVRGINFFLDSLAGQEDPGFRELQFQRAQGNVSDEGFENARRALEEAKQQRQDLLDEAEKTNRILQEQGGLQGVQG